MRSEGIPSGYWSLHTLPHFNQNHYLPHSLSFRPLVVPESSSICIQPPPHARCTVRVSFDGKKGERAGGRGERGVCGRGRVRTGRRLVRRWLGVAGPLNLPPSLLAHSQPPAYPRSSSIPSLPPPPPLVQPPAYSRAHRSSSIPSLPSPPPLCSLPPAQGLIGHHRDHAQPTAHDQP